MLTSAALFAAALALRLLTVNRHVRGRLLTSAVLFGAHALLSAALVVAPVTEGLRQALAPALPLVLAFGVVNALVTLAVNPWRADRLSDRFPTIVQDSITIVLFALVAVALLQEKVFATTAVGAVVLGFALQDTLGNLFAGLAIQIEKPFRVGDWVRVADTDGLVSEITWRATKVRTKAGNFVIVPNSTLAKDTITNYSAPTPDTRIEVEVGASYDAPPNLVKATIRAAIADEPALVGSREPEILLLDFGASAIVYRVRVWSTDFAADERIRDRMRTAIYYAFKRASISIPYPIQVEIPGDAASAAAPDAAAIETVLRRVDIFATLDDRAFGDLGAAARPLLFAAGEAVVRQGQPGASMYVVVRGQAVVTLDPGGQEVARFDAGAFFGEMSLLTGAARNATVRALSDLEVLELTADAFRSVVLANPDAVDRIGLAAARRAAELETARAAGGSPAAPEPAGRFLARVRRFLRLA
ncbi:MAG: mechanosensitive ion channel domain-containing protein [Vicinamibacterales bacterium]